jgi:cytochrome c oxidase assembly protein subunit 15
MVASGLAARVSVSQYRLAFHMTLACGIYAAIVWAAQSLRWRRKRPAARPRLRVGAMVLLCLVLLEIYLGALVAGLDAGMTFNTWPLIDGALVPSADRLWFETPAWRNLFENALTVQFNHRLIAYLLWLLVLLHALDAWCSGSAGINGPLALAAAVTLQAGVGIVTLLNAAPVALALTHQAVAIVVLTIAVIHAERLAPHRAGSTVASTIAAASDSRGTA